MKKFKIKCLLLLVLTVTVLTNLTACDFILKNPTEPFIVKRCAVSVTSTSDTIKYYYNLQSIEYPVHGIKFVSSTHYKVGDTIRFTSYKE